GFTLRGALDTQQLRVTDGSVAALGGALKGAGDVSWAPAPSWSAAGAATDLDPVSLRPDLPGHLTFGFTVRGSGFDATSEFALQVRDLAGELRKFPLRGSGEIERQGAVWQLHNLKADLGHTSLALDGTVSRELALRFHVQAEDLSLLAPDF